MWLLWLFIAIPLIEIALFIQVGGLIGLWPTLAIVVITAVIGTSLMRSQGARAMGEVQQSFARMQDPSRPLAHGAMILVAGVLLLTPGFFTDTVGLLLLIPAVRDFVMRQAAKRVKVTRVDFSSTGYPPRQSYDDDVIDAEYVVEPDPASQPAPRPGNSGWTRQ